VVHQKLKFALEVLTVHSNRDGVLLAFFTKVWGVDIQKDFNWFDLVKMAFD